MGILKGHLAKAKRQRREDHRRIRAFAALVKDMEPERNYTLKRSDGKIITMTGAQWRDITYSQSYHSA